MLSREGAVAFILVFAPVSYRQILEVTSYMIYSGGGRLAAGSFVLTGTIGQADSGTTLQARSLTSRGGSWRARSVCVGDIADDSGIPGADGRVSFGDFLALLGLVGPCQ